MNRIFASVTLFAPIFGSSTAIAYRLRLKDYDKIRQEDEFDASLETFLMNSVLVQTQDDLSMEDAVKPLTKDIISNLPQPDVSTFMEILTEMLSPNTAEIKKLCSDIEGDGYSRPIFVPLRFPVSFGSETISGLEFSAKKFSELRDLFRSSETGNLSRELMRRIGKPVGANIPLSDSVLDQLDYMDYLRIRDGALGKLQGAGQKRWSRQ